MTFLRGKEPLHCGDNMCVCVGVCGWVVDAIIDTHLTTPSHVVVHCKSHTPVFACVRRTATSTATSKPRILHVATPYPLVVHCKSHIGVWVFMHFRGRPEDCVAAWFV